VQTFKSISQKILIFAVLVFIYQRYFEKDRFDTFFDSLPPQILGVVMIVLGLIPNDSTDGWYRNYQRFMSVLLVAGGVAMIFGWLV